MGALEHLPGYKIEMLNFPFLDKTVKLYTFIKNEDLNPEVHDKIIKYLYEEVEEITKDKYYESQKAGFDIGWHGGFLHWLEHLENGFREYHQKNGWECHPREFEYSFIIKENGDVVWVIKKDLETKARNYIQVGAIVEASCKNNEDRMMWVNENAKKIASLIDKKESDGGCLIHGWKTWQKYDAWRNLEERIKEESSLMQKIEKEK